jgi:hypothetical protein
LLDVGLLRRAIRVEPAAAALLTADPTKPPHNEVALGLWCAAPTRVVVVPGFRAYPDAVKVGRFADDLVASLMKAVVPLRVLDDQSCPRGRSRR